MKSIKLKNEGSLLLAKNEVQAENFSARFFDSFPNWRREWDLNPREGQPLYLISSQALSTAQPPLLLLLYFIPYFIEKAF